MLKKKTSPAGYWALVVTLLALNAAACGRHWGPRPKPKAHSAAQSAQGDPNAASPRSSAPGAVHFAIIGDFGASGLPERQVADLVHSWQPEFVVSLGDNNYPNGGQATLDENVGKYYGTYIALKKGAHSAYPTSPEQRFFPCLGNHDWRAEGARPYLDYFNLPGNGRYYTVSHGPVDLFIVDSDPHEPDGVDANSVQAKWLKQALKVSSAPWKLVILHHPPYSSGSHGSNTWMQWPYQAWGASMVLGGHDHAYEHVVMDGMHYMVMGISGAPRDRFKVACALPRAEQDDCYDGNYGALNAEVSPSDLIFKLITVDGRVHDTVHLSRDPTAAPDAHRAAKPPSP